MNIEILKKCLLECEMDHPKLDYLRGMLEALIAMTPKEATPAEIRTVLGQPNFVAPPQAFNSGNAGIPARGNIEEIKRLAGESQ